jgi:hypothetical protein
VKGDKKRKRPGFVISSARLFYEMEANWEFCGNSFHLKPLSGKCDFQNVLEIIKIHKQIHMVAGVQFFWYRKCSC